jgi:hypothetical protein
MRMAGREGKSRRPTQAFSVRHLLLYNLYSDCCTLPTNFKRTKCLKTLLRAAEKTTSTMAAPAFSPGCDRQISFATSVDASKMSNQTRPGILRHWYVDRPPPFLMTNSILRNSPSVQNAESQGHWSPTRAERAGQ